MNKCFFFALVVLCTVNISFAKSSALMDDNDSILTIVPGDTTLKTTYIQNAINYVNTSGGGKVILTQGTYRIGPISMKSNVNLYIDTLCTLLGSPNMADWTVGGSLLNLINNGGKTLSNVNISGRGTIDGSGAPWWAAYNANNAISRPRLIYISNTTNLTIDSVYIRNSPSFNVVPSNCTNVVIDHVNIYDTANSPNTDGIDPSDCKNVLITNCTIDVGDDNIAIKAGRNNSTLVPGACQDITVANCTFKHGHGLSVGSETDDGFLNLRATGCTFSSTTNGIRVKSGAGLGGLCQNLYYSNITMSKVTNPIVIDMNYSTSTTYPTDIPSVNGLYINNLTVTGASNAGTIAGITNGLVQNVVFSNVNITATTGKMTISNAAGVTLTNCIINKAAAKSGTNVILTNVTGTRGF